MVMYLALLNTGMLIEHIIYETPEEDHDLYEIGDILADFLKQYHSQIAKNPPKELGTIGTLINFPTDDPIMLELLKAKVGFQDMPPGNHGAAYGKRLIALNQDEFVNMKSSADFEELGVSIAHELRHTLDTIKSRSINPQGYNKTARDTSTPGAAYQSTRAELNARTEEAQVALARTIKKYVQAEQEAPTAQQLEGVIKTALANAQVAEYFPQGLQDRGYRRLVNRLLQFGDYAGQKYVNELTG
jgi:hypothetical protein